MKIYKTISLILMVVFIIVGVIFLFIPDKVLLFFNHIGTGLGMAESPVHGVNIYLVLAVGYMYLVALFAFLMYQNPKNSIFPLLLAHAKLVSSILSLVFFVIVGPYLIFITNCVVDGMIGIIALIFYHKVAKISA